MDSQQHHGHGFLYMQAFDHSAYQVQAYDPSAASCYAYSYPQYGSDVHQQYLYYNNTAQPHQQEVHQEPNPPGVSDPSQQAQMYYHHQYYQHAGAVNVNPHLGGVGAGVLGGIPAQERIVQPSYGGGVGRIDGRSPHGGARGHSGHTPSVVRRPFCDRGHDRCLTLHVPPKHAPAHALNQITAAGVCHLQKLHGVSSVKLTAILQKFLKCTGKGKSI